MADLRDVERTWRFLCHQGVVADASEGSQQLAIAIKTETARGRITGGSLAFRVAGLLDASLLLAASSSPDPFGLLAAQHWKAFQGEAR